MSFYKKSLRIRIFISMISLVIGASILIALMTIFQYKKDSQAFHRDRLLRKEAAIRENINYVLKTTTYPVETQQIPLIFKDRIYEIKDIHKLEIYLYDLNGNLIKSSKPSFFKDTVASRMSDVALRELRNSPQKKYIKEFTEEGQKYQSSYSYITDNYFKPLAILNLPYIEDNDQNVKELEEFLYRLGMAYVFMLFLAVALAYFLSKYIMRSMKTVSDKIALTRFHTGNKKINIKDAPEEIAVLVHAYNAMIDELEKSAGQLAASERETAWREMAKQVAHEIKNPLTPMRLTTQSFQRQFDSNDPNIDQKVAEYTNTMIQQIDTLSSIASAFSTYAKMPAQQDETLEVVNIVKIALDIFNEDFIYFSSEVEQVRVQMDRTQLVRVITNLVKNSIQSIAQKGPDAPMVDVRIEKEDAWVIILVKDNGVGIPLKNKDVIFEPQFTTKSSGMGLGLGMVKSIVEAYHGQISFTSNADETVFEVRFPIIPLKFE